MNRRDLLKLIPGAVAVAALPLPVHLEKKASGRFFRLGDAAFAELRTDEHVKRGDFVMCGGVPSGVAMESARAGDWVPAQVYGHVSVNVK